MVLEEEPRGSRTDKHTKSGRESCCSNNRHGAVFHRGITVALLPAMLKDTVGVTTAPQNISRLHVWGRRNGQEIDM